MRVLITGASGLVGGALSRHLRTRGDTVFGVSRNPQRHRQNGGAGRVDAWHGWDEVSRLVEEVDAVVHLAGEPVAGRWSAKKREAMRDSRVARAQELTEAIERAASPPRVYVSASGTHYYGTEVEGAATESSPPGDGFLAELCRDWEAAVQAAPIRCVSVRCGIVLSREGGMLPQLLPAFRFGVGPLLGNGRQGFSWIHVEDVVHVYTAAIDDGMIQGPINGTAPQPTTYRTFAKELGRHLHRPVWLRVPDKAVEVALGEAAQVPLADQAVYPVRLEQRGFPFRFPAIHPAMTDLIG